MTKWWHARFDEARNDERVIIAVMGCLKDADPMLPPSRLAPDQRYETNAISGSSGEQGEGSGEEEVLVGYVMMTKPITETGPFRGSVEKLLVNPRFRRRGIARVMMEMVEVVGKECGRTLLVSLVYAIS